MKKNRANKLDTTQSKLTRADQIQDLIEQGVPLQRIESDLDYCDLAQQAEIDGSWLRKLLTFFAVGFRRLLGISKVGNIAPTEPKDPAKTQSQESL